MGTFGIISLVLGLLGLAGGAGVSIMNAQKNERLVRETNEANLQAVRETNASNVEQAELAYRRSLPINQVNNMMAAGMSKTAAIQSLSGGGTYQAPVLQSSHADAPQVDYSGISSALERLGNIPSNAEQYNIQQQQRKNLEQEFQLRENEERRKQEMHNALIDEKNYSKWERESMDSFLSLMENTAQEKNIQPSPNQSMHDYVRALGLQDNEMYKKIPVSARQRAFDKYKQIQDEKRAQQSSADSHDLANFDKLLKHSELSERKQTLVYKLGVLANQLELSNLSLDKENYDKAIRDAGFANKIEAAEAIAAAENLEAITRRNKSRFTAARSDNYASQLGYSIEWLLDKVNPLKGLISSK